MNKWRRQTEQIQVGDRVRTFDYDNRDDCFADGVVQGIGPRPDSECEHYYIEVERMVWKGEEQEADGDMVYPPINGTKTSMGFSTNYVVTLERALAEASKEKSSIPAPSSIPGSPEERLRGVVAELMELHQVVYHICTRSFDESKRNVTNVAILAMGNAVKAVRAALSAVKAVKKGEEN
jgi:hypothetical protein